MSYSNPESKLILAPKPKPEEDVKLKHSRPRIPYTGQRTSNELIKMHCFYPGYWKTRQYEQVLQNATCHRGPGSSPVIDHKRHPPKLSFHTQQCRGADFGTRPLYETMALFMFSVDLKPKRG